MYFTVYPGEPFRLRLLALLAKYEGKLEVDCSDPKNDGTIQYYLKWKRLNKEKMDKVRNECTELSKISIHPCTSKMHKDFCEFAVGSEKAAAGCKMFAQYFGVASTPAL